MLTAERAFRIKNIFRELEIPPEQLGPERTPRRKLFYYKLASALCVDDRPKSAISVLEKGLALFPEDETATLMLQEIKKVVSSAGTR